jgi:YQGE family putative transporter
LSASQKLLLTIHGAYGLAATMSGLFLNLYLWRITQDMAINALFTLVTFFFTTVGFWLGGRLSKQRDRLISYQLGVAFTAIFYLIVIVLQETVATIPIIIGIINGFAGGFYWLGFLVLVYDLVDMESRSAFMGKQMAVFGLVNMIGPALAGFVISQFDSLFGYTIIFSFSFLLFIIGGILCLRLPKDISPKKKFKVGLLWRFNKRFKSLKGMWVGWTIWGICEGIIMFLPPLLIYEAVADEFMVGLVIIMLGVLSILASLWHSRYNPKHREPYTVLFTWIAYTLGSLPLLFEVNLWTVLLFLIINEIAKALIGVSYFSFMLGIIGLLPNRAGLRTESMVLRETVLNSGRMISAFLFIVVYKMSQESIYYLLFATILIQGLLYVLMIRGKEEIKEIEPEKMH